MLVAGAELGHGALCLGLGVFFCVCGGGIISTLEKIVGVPAIHLSHQSALEARGRGASVTGLTKLARPVTSMCLAGPWEAGQCDRSITGTLLRIDKPVNR